MSYLRYSPDVRPPPAELVAPPPGRAVRWLAGVLLYLALVAGWAWWMVQPPKLLPPLVLIPLPDGTELRIVHAAHGPAFFLDSDDTFGGKIYSPEYAYGDESDGRSYPPYHFEGYENNQTFSAPPSSTWLILTQFAPKTKHLYGPSSEGLGGIWVAEENPHFLHRIIRHPQSAQSWSATEQYFAPVVPARAKTWQIQVSYHGEMVHATMTNPFPVTPAREFTPLPLPQKATINGATIELKGFKRAQCSEWVLTGLPQALPQFEVTLADLRKPAFETTYELFDATGNATTNGVLPFSEPAWGIKIRAVQRESSPLTKQDVAVLGETTIPANGEMVALEVPPFLAQQGVTDIFFTGAGWYRFGDGVVRSTGADGKLRKLALHYDLNTSQSASSPCVFIVAKSMTRDLQSPDRRAFTAKMDRIDQSNFQIFDGEKVQSLQTTGSLISSGSSGSEYFAIFTRQFDLSKQAKANPAAKIRVEFIDPKVFEATFYFLPPDVGMFK